MTKRNEGESFADYKSRRSEEQEIQKDALRGKVLVAGTQYNRKNSTRSK